MRILRSIILSWIVLGFSCASLQNPKLPPTFVLKEIAMADATLSDSLLVFRLEIQNPNSVALNFDSIDYTIKIKDQNYSGHLDHLPKAKPKTNVEVEIPLKVILSDIFDSITLAMYEKETTYELNATLAVGGLIIPLKQVGRVAILPP